MLAQIDLSIGYYDFFITYRDLERLKNSPLESYLLENQTKRTGKKIVLSVGDTGFKEIDLSTIPEDAGWDRAERMIITINENIYRFMERRTTVDNSYRGYLSYGEVFIHLVAGEEIT